MGCILSARNKQAQSDDGSKNTIKLVLLGISNSGKSTLLKQMKCLYGGGFEPHEKESFKSIVAANLINGFMTIALHIENNGIRIKSKRALQAIEHFKSLTPYSSGLTPETIGKAKILWQHVEHIIPTMGKFDYCEALCWLMKNIDVVTAPDYTPTDTDFMRLRLRTTGFHEITFKTKKHNFVLLDAGGHKSERRKWPIACKDAHAIIFFSGLDDYDIQSVDTPGQTRLQESLGLWEELLSNSELSNIPVLLFLNKLDLFKDKLPKYPLEKVYQTYKAGNDVKEAIEFIKSRFLRRIPKGCNSNRIEMYTTCAVDSDSIKIVADKALNFIIEQRLALSGLSPKDSH